jgi:acetyl-CoA synthetase
MSDNQENKIYGPNPEVAATSHIGSMEEYERLYRLSLDDPETFWGKQAESISWFHPPRMVFDHDYDNVDFSWYLGGRLNACYNCVDRHLEDKGDQDAIIWVKDEPGEYEHITYRQLKHEVAKVANVLKAHGVRKGDRIAIYMPMIP